MLQIRDLEKIKNDPKKIEELLYDDERKLLHQYEKMMERASAAGNQYIIVNSVPAELMNLLKLSGYAVRVREDDYAISWSYDNAENSEVESKQTIKLQDDSFVEIDGANVKHISENGQILYDSTNRVAYNQENLDNVRNGLKGPKETAVGERLKDFMPYLEEPINE